MTSTMTAKEIGLIVGRAIARDVLGDRDMPRDWRGLDAQDGDEIAAVGITPGSPEWAEAEAVARREYLRLIADAS